VLEIDYIVSFNFCFHTFTRDPSDDKI